MAFVVIHEGDSARRPCLQGSCMAIRPGGCNTNGTRARTGAERDAAIRLSSLRCMEKRAFDAWSHAWPGRPESGVVRSSFAFMAMVISVTSRFERLLWLMPCAYAIHIGDEWFSGFPRYVVDHMGGHPMPPTLFFLNNACFMLVLLALCAWASRSTSRLSAFLLMSWASGNLFWNFVAHLFYTVDTGAYSPGLVTSSLLYYPVSLLVVVAAVHEERMSVTGALGAFAIGGALLVLVIWGGVYHFAT